MILLLWRMGSILLGCGGFWRRGKVLRGMLMLDLLREICFVCFIAPLHSLFSSSLPHLLHLFSHYVLTNSPLTQPNPKNNAA
jgi:hypothetical protein